MSDTALSSAAIKLLFETGDIPTQQNFADAWTSYPNLVDNNQLDGYASSLVAVAPPVQSTALQLTARFNLMSGTIVAVGGVKLPAALISRSCMVFNIADFAIDVFPTTGQTIVPLSTNDPVRLKPTEYAVFTCYSNNLWAVQKFSFYDSFIKVYKAKVTQSGTGAPVANVLVNTTGQSISWSRSAVGRYTLSSTDLFVTDKYFVELTPQIASTDQRTLGTTDNTGDEPTEIYMAAFTFENDYVDNNVFYISIEVYP